MHATLVSTTHDPSSATPATPDKLAIDVLAVLAAPLRLEILLRLHRSACDVSTLADALELDIDHVSYHLRKLRKFGLVEFSRDRTRHVYFIAAVVSLDLSGESLRVTVRFPDTGNKPMSMAIPF